MPIEQKVIQIGGQKEEFFKPILTKWKGVEMIRNQTPKTAIHSIVQYAKRLDYVKIGIVGDPHCVIGETRIALSNGRLVQIKSLGEKHLQEINIPILSGTNANGRGIAKVFHSYEKQPVIEIITKSGKRIVGTYNHPLLRFIKNKEAERKSITEWTRLDKLKIGDELKISTKINNRITQEPKLNFKKHENKFGPKYKGSLPIRLSKELAGVLGYIIGDGWYRDKAIGFCVAPEEIDILPKLLKMMQDSFNVKPFIYIRKPRPHFGKKGFYNEKQEVTYVEYFNLTLVHNLSFLKEKRVPELIFNSTNESTAYFIRWLFEADGSVFNKGRGKNGITLKSIRVDLLRDVQLLLLRFGIHARIVSDQLLIRRGKEIQKFAKYIGFVSDKKTNKLKDLIKDAKNFGRVKTQLYEKIVSIKRLEKLYTVYDIEEPIHHQFIANGLISHNTGKTTLAKFMAHFLHLMLLDLLGITYIVKIFTRDELLSFKKTIESLPAANYIFIFDDVSWIEKEGSAQQINELKAGESMIRHFKDKKDVKIIQIDNYHYTKAENKYLRQSHFKIFTAIGSEEEDNINAITKNSNPFVISQFAKLQTEMYSQGTYTFLIGKNRRNFTMKYRDPFIPVLFWDGRSLRFIVTPEREWMDRGCAICSMAEGIKDENFNLEKFKQEMDNRYGEIIAKNAVKLKMKEFGLNTYRPELTRAINKISKTITEQDFDLMQLGVLYGLKLTPPPKRIKLDKILKNEKEKPKNDSDKNLIQVIPWEGEEVEKIEVIQ